MRLRQRELRVPALSVEGVAVAALRGVSLAFGGVPILRSVDLEVRAGEVLAVLGPNGAGKSTTLGVLAGDHRPDSGTVTIDGAPYASWTPDELAVRRGVLLQQIEMSFPFTVTQVVRMGRAPWSGTPAEDWDDDVVAEALVQADVAQFTDRVFTSLSGGERVRAALARVLAQEPTMLLLDEPTAALDLRHQELVLTLVRERAARGDAVVVVMHDVALASAYADRVALMSGGELRAVGPPVEVLTAELLSELYEHPIEVFPHPRDGSLMILPRREWRTPS